MTSDELYAKIQAEIVRVAVLNASSRTTAAVKLIIEDIAELIRCCRNGKFTLANFNVAGPESNLHGRMHAAVATVREPVADNPVLLICAEPTQLSTTWCGLGEAAQWANPALHLAGGSDPDHRFDGLGVSTLGWGAPPKPPYGGRDDSSEHARNVALVAQLLSDTIEQLGDRRLVLCIPPGGPDTADLPRLLCGALRALNRDQVKNLYALVSEPPVKGLRFHDLPSDIPQLDLEMFLNSPRPIASLRTAVDRAMLLRGLTRRHVGQVELSGGPLGASGLNALGGSSTALIGQGVTTSDHVVVQFLKRPAGDVVPATPPTPTDGQTKAAYITVILDPKDSEALNLNKIASWLTSEVRKLNPTAQWYFQPPEQEPRLSDKQLVVPIPPAPGVPGHGRGLGSSAAGQGRIVPFVPVIPRGARPGPGVG
ncbi:MAG: hypothetical protein ACRDPW_01365 [Mycobacteriales bacterium]